LKNPYLFEGKEFASWKMPKQKVMTAMVPKGLSALDAGAKSFAQQKLRGCRASVFGDTRNAQSAGVE